MKYFFNFIKHKWFVLVEGIRFGGIPLWQLIIHDWSKMMPSEWGYYIIFKHGLSAFDSPRFQESRKKHYKKNPHHHAHWQVRGNPVPMPVRYVREMVVDWIAANKSYGRGGGDIRAWLKKNYPNMKLHPTTKKRLANTLSEIDIDIDSL